MTVIPIDRITAEARDVKFGFTILTIIGAIFYGLGWITAKVFTVLWLVVVWSVVAIKLGWNDARKSARST